MNSDLQLARLRFSRRLAAAAAVALSLGLPPGAHAEGPEGLTPNRCAGLGGNFVAVAGARGCVRIGGHIRAEPTHSKPDLGAYPTGFGAAFDGVRPAAETFHLHAGAPGGGSSVVPR
jgi:hypothetical protein